MKTINHLPKRVLSFVLALVMVLSLVPMAAFAAEETGTTLYLKPNENWLQGDARFAVYYWNNSGNAWVDMTASDEDGMYEAVIPSGYTNIIFCRMNPNAAENSWDNKWNQTADLTVPTDDTNCYTVADGTWDNGGGTWSAYSPALVLYLKPNSNWLNDGARFAAYFFGADPVVWVDMTDADSDGYYECEAPEGYSSVIFCRMNPNAAENSWDNKWNQTADLTVPTDDTNCYTVADGTWDNGGGTWSVYPPEEEEEPAPSDPEETVTDYYLVGYINAADYSGEGYKFVDGELTVTFTADSYVAVKSSATDSWYMTNGWLGTETTSAVLATDYATTDKLYVPGNVELTFTLVENADDTLTLSYAEAAAEPATDYYLVGYINAADYSGEDYKFVDGELTVTFTADSYVAVKSSATDSWYMTNGWLGTETTSAVLATDYATTDKLYVPGNVELTFTLVENADDTLTLSYAEAAAEPATDYYLVGYINAADYSGEDYKFVDGELTATFTASTYVAIKSSANENWYMTDGWLGSVTSATLYDSSTIDNEDKLQLPENTEITLSLTENADGTLTLSYAEAKDTTAVTIHFLKPDTWANTIHAYAWTGADLGGWPGTPVSENAEHAGWYDLVVEQEVPTGFSFIFNVGSDANKTADLATGEVTGDTELWVMDGKVLTEAPQEWFGIYTYNISIHFKNEAAWETVNVKFGQGDSWDPISGYEDYKNNEFGVAMEEDSFNEGWYSLTVTVTGNDSAINGLFNKGAWGEGNQTGNWTTGTLTGDQDFWYTNGAMTTTAPEGWFNANMKVYVPGTFPGPSWDAASNLMTFDAELGLYTYTFEDVPAANYEFKIAINGSWAENYGAGGVKDGANIAVTVPQTMDVIVYYNSTTHNAVTNVNYVFADVTLTGTGIPDGTKLTDKGLTGIYSVTVPMIAGTYTDIVIKCDDTQYPFAEVVVEEDKDVTFYIDPVTGIFYCDASDIPIDTASIVFDSQDETYKAPFGAVAQNEEVTFSIATGDDVSSAVLVIKGVDSVPMTKGEDGLWTATTSIANMGEYDYYFALSNGSTIAIYGDDDGYYGTGKVSELTDVMPYDLVVYEAGYETPDWMKNAVIYQIFPDRFFDGDSTNNQAQTWARGDVDYEFITDWYTLPENPEQKAMLDKDTYLSSGAHYGDGEWSNEIYGGDLEGITERIDYLKALGVNVIYLNPVFWSISNHRYDAVSYTEIDPILGTLGDFEELVAIAEANDMHIILDGVFNHVSDDSVYFDRYYKFLPDAAEKYDGKIGAYPYWAYVYDYMAEKGVGQATAEGVAKTHFTKEYGITDYSYTEWFAVSSTKTGDVYSYEGWWGYDSMPVIKSTNGSEYQTGNWAEEIIDGQNSVNAYWISKGMDGWRLDVANEVSDETWQKFRDSVKALDSEAVIIGEIWDDATKYLMGDMYDSVMNYQFRNAVTKYAMGTNSVETTKSMEKIRERYPEEAFYAMMNLVGSHDTSRLLSYLDGIGDDRADKSFDAAFPTYEKTSQLAKDRQYLVSFLQFTYAGAPTIYYGDEIGMVGSDDPDDRRAFEWGKGNQELVEWYAKLAAIREAYPALRTGTVEPMDLGNDALLAFARSDDADTLVVIGNNSASNVTVDNLPTVMSTTGYVDLVTGESWDGTVSARNGVILVTEDQAKEITVNTADLAPAYDPAYIVSEEGREHTSHSYEKVVTDPTCTEDGYTTYTCACGDTYIDDEVPATGHTGGTATCKDKAVCSVCEQAYGELDADNHAGGTEVKDAVAATEEKTGYTGDTYCKGCDELLEEGESIPKLSHKHKLVKTPAKAATEYAEGNIEYYTCYSCGKLYKDAEGKEEITKADTVIEKLAHTHKLRKTAAKEATKYTQGNIEYYTCTKCGKIYKDAKATKEITLKDTVIPKITDNVATGDNSGVVFWTTMLVVSAMGIAVVSILILKNRKRS